MALNPANDLSQIAHVLLGKRRFIFIFILCSIVFGVVLFFIFPPKYEAETVFILKNPLYSDKNNLYNNAVSVDYFASDDDIDKLITLAQSDTVQDKIISMMHLASAYKYDTSKPKQVVKLRRYFNRHLKIYRTENKNVVLTYTDKNPERAAATANLAVEMVERSLHSFYNEMRWDMWQSIENKIHDEDSAVRVLTDTLVALREKYGIYDIISPSRNNLMLTALKSNGKADFANGVEQIQNIESIKDELVSDRSRHITLANQYSPGTKINTVPLTAIVSVAKPPIKANGPGIIVIIVAAAFAGFLASAFYLLLAGFIQNKKVIGNAA